MSKYIIEIEEKPLCVFDKDTQTFFPRLWRVKGFNSLVLDEEGLSRLEELNSDYINEHFGWLQDDAYQRGLDDAWECMKKIAFLEKPRDMRDFLGHTTFGGILTGYTAAEAIAKLKAYEEKQKADGEIKVGDEVIYNGTTKCIVVRPEDDERYASLIDSDGTHYSADHRECKKTGRHFDIKSILEDMRHD